MIIIGITGTIGAGKGTVVDHLKDKYAFVHYSARDVIVEEIEKRGLEVNRDTMRAVANDLRREHGPFYIAESLYVRACKAGTNAIIESLRTVAEINFLRELAQISQTTFILLAVDAEIQLRYQRICTRAGVTDMVSYEVFQQQNIVEMSSTDPYAQNIRACIELADIKLLNNGTIAELQQAVDLEVKLPV